MWQKLKKVFIRDEGKPEPPETLEEELEGRIESSKESISSGQSDLEQDIVIESSIPVTFYGMALESRDIAVSKALLGEIEEARKWFGKAADRYVQSRWMREEYEEKVEKASKESIPRIYSDALQCAIISGEWSKVEEVADEVAMFDEEFLEEFRTSANELYYSKCLANLILENEEATRRNLENLASGPRGRPRHRNLPNFVRSFLDGDVEAIEDAIRKQLTSHKSGIHQSDDRRKTSDELVSMEAICWIIMARRKGFNIGIEDRFIPENLIS